MLREIGSRILRIESPIEIDQVCQIWRDVDMSLAGCQKHIIMPVCRFRIDNSHFVLIIWSMCAADAKYSISESQLPEPFPRCVLEKVSINAGKIITGGVTIARGQRDRPLHLSRKGLVPKLRWIHAKYVILWDEKDKRGWLVNGTGALLHLLQASLVYESDSPFNSVFLSPSEKWKEASVTHKSDSALRILLDQSNMKLRMFPEKPESWDEQSDKQRFYCVGDRVEELYDTLEKIIEHQAGANGKDGIDMDLNPRRRLEGWEFLDIAKSRDPFHPRVETFPTIGFGWVNLAHEINAVTLFGREFGGIIQPPDPGVACCFWTDLPKFKH